MEWHRRNRPRIPVHYPVQLHSDDNMGGGTLLNLSAAGCQVRSTLPLEAGTYVAVQIALPDQAQPVAVELSIVRWQQQGRLGLEFLKYGQGERERLIHLTSTCTWMPDERLSGVLSESTVLAQAEPMAFAGPAE